MITSLRSLVFFIVLIIPALQMEAGETNDIRMNNYNVSHYTLSVAFDVGRKAFTGSVVVSAEAIEPMNVCVLSASNQTLIIDSVIADHTQLTFHHDSGHLTITMPSTVGAHSSFHITVFYHGTSGFKGAYDDGGIYFSDAGRIISSSEPQFARRWWPCKDMPSDKATMATNFTVPEELTAVSNGVLKHVDRHDDIATFSWETQYPIATYLVSIAAARYTELTETYETQNGDRMKIVNYVFPEDVKKAKEDYKNVSRFLKFFSQRLCEYPFIKEKFGYAEVEGNTTMENQTICSIQNTLLTGDRKNELTIFHETAHQWFGDLITTADWHHTWLNEGFATYAEALYLEYTEGRKLYQWHINRLMSPPIGVFAHSVVGKSDTAFWDSFGASVYFKGAIVLHMLRGMMGDNTFFTAMRNYLTNPRLRYASATTEDFKLECEHASGTDLSWFFNQWVYASSDSIDRPILSYSWTAESDTNAFSVSLTVRQENASTMLYRLPLPLVIYTGDSSQTIAVTDSAAEQTFRFTVPTKPDSILIDPNNTVFKFLTKTSAMK